MDTLTRIQDEIIAYWKSKKRGPSTRNFNTAVKRAHKRLAPFGFTYNETSRIVEEALDVYYLDTGYYID